MKNYVNEDGTWTVNSKPTNVKDYADYITKMIVKQWLMNHNVKEEDIYIPTDIYSVYDIACMFGDTIYVFEIKTRRRGRKGACIGDYDTDMISAKKLTELQAVKAKVEAKGYKCKCYFVAYLCGDGNMVIHNMEEEEHTDRWINIEKTNDFANRTMQKEKIMYFKHSDARWVEKMYVI